MEEINAKINQYKIPILLSVVGLVLIIGGIFSSGLTNIFISKSAKNNFPKESLVASSSAQIKVDIAGAINNPGVYDLSKEARVEDAIKVAGGFSSSVNINFISKSLNLSQKLSDGQKIYVPFEGEQIGGVVGGATTPGGGFNSKIGINSASDKELDSLPGIGLSTAAKIISSRPYQDIGELVSKKVISKAVFEKIKDLIDLN